MANLTTLPPALGILNHAVFPAPPSPPVPKSPGGEPISPSPPGAAARSNLTSVASAGIIKLPPSTNC